MDDKNSPEPCSRVRNFHRFSHIHTQYDAVKSGAHSWNHEEFEGLINPTNNNTDVNSLSVHGLNNLYGILWRKITSFCRQTQKNCLGLCSLWNCMHSAQRLTIMWFNVLSMHSQSDLHGSRWPDEIHVGFDNFTYDNIIWFCNFSSPSLLLLFQFVWSKFNFIFFDILGTLDCIPRYRPYLPLPSKTL